MQTNAPSRNYSIDAMRAILVMLGIVLHSALAYSTTLRQFCVNNLDTSHSSFFNMVVLSIHAFRMEAFFLLAGYFAYKTEQRYGVRELIMRRAKRIGIPFLVCYLVPVVGLITFGSIAKMSNLHNLVLERLNVVGVYWFLYDLLVMYALTVLALPVLKSCQKYLTAVPTLIVSSAVMMGLLIAKGDWFTPLDLHLMINPASFIPYFIFFLAGWGMAANKFLPRLSGRVAPLCLLASVVGLALYFHLYLAKTATHWAFVSATGLYVMLGWTMTFALIGYCQRFFTRQSRSISYLAGASYWLYLAQMFVIEVIQGPLAASGMSIYLQWVVTIVATTGVLLLAYRWFIEKTWLRQYIGVPARAIPTAN